VHEILTSFHDQGQAKYLEAALRNARNRGTVEKSIQTQVNKCKTVAEIGLAVARGVEIAAIHILGDAQQLCPIDTGFLASSATWQGQDGPGSGANPAGITKGTSRANARKKKIAKKRAAEKAKVAKAKVQQKNLAKQIRAKAKKFGKGKWHGKQ
jgi:hypothetical protein